MYLPGQLQTLCTNTNLVSGSQGTRLPTLPLDQFLQSVPRSLNLASLHTFTLYRYHQLHKYGTGLTWDKSFLPLRSFTEVDWNNQLISSSKERCHYQNKDARTEGKVGVFVLRYFGEFCFCLGWVFLFVLGSFFCLACCGGGREEGVGCFVLVFSMWDMYVYESVRDQRRYKGSKVKIHIMQVTSPWKRCKRDLCNASWKGFRTQIKIHSFILFVLEEIILGIFFVNKQDCITMEPGIF